MLKNEINLLKLTKLILNNKTITSLRLMANRTTPIGTGSGSTGKQFWGETSKSLYQNFSQPLPLMNIRMPPPPPPPIIVNCGELREYHHGALVELYGRVSKQRMGRFIELKDSNGVVQLVAPDTDRNLEKRFSNMPIDSMISVLGYVHRRPTASKNASMATGGIEVHVQAINMVRLPDKQSKFQTQKRQYNSNSSKELNRSITSTEYKKTKYDNIIKFFENREVTCGELRLEDAGRTVSLVGWLDPKKRGKFMEVIDGYGHTQIVNEQTNLEIVSKITSINDDDIVLISGRVMVRPFSNHFIKSETGEIEVFIENFKVLTKDDVYDGPILASKHQKIASSSDSRDGITGSGNSGNGNSGDGSKPLPKLSKYTYRTHNCGELNEKSVGEDVVLCGWIEYQRMRKFLILRDAYGSIQILIPENFVNAAEVEAAPFETIIKISGKVIARPLAMRNDNLSTGAIEILADTIEILNNCRKNLPVEMREFNRPKESLRLEYRYLDMRFPDMQHNMRLRSSILMKTREYLINNLGFVEVETPTLFRRTPGGAQEFIVPTRKPGQFYSLVQSPQQFKQMLMAGAIDRYFQIARCYRDESTRPDRQPEFTQLDIELSFTNRENIIEMIEDLLVHILPTRGDKLTTPFPRMTYDEAMEKYGVDKPDIRYGFELQNVTTSFNCKEEIKIETNDFAAYAVILKNPNNALPNSLKTNLDKISKHHKVKFYASRVKESVDKWTKNGLGKNLCEVANSIAKETDLKSQDLLLLTFGKKIEAQSAMGKIRLAMIDSLAQRDLVPQRNSQGYSFLWVLDFPMFLRNEETKELESVHHPFTAPHEDDLHLLTDKKDCENIRSQAYDLVLNGHEIGGGSIRIHDPTLQTIVLRDILKIDYNHLKHLIEALGSGCPPHGGIALGIDRLMSVICGTTSIRDVIAFPKAFDGKDPLSKAPCEISDEEKKLYHIDIVNKEFNDEIQSNNIEKEVVNKN